MVRLTEDMIVARTRVSDMAHVKKLNCWGAELTDVSVLRKLSNVEVLSLSVNSIATLSDIGHCKNLQELYIRKNKIPDISEICWLQDLSRLKNLWLEENPCAEGASELYRLTVIKALPQLQKLDNIQVSSEEMAEACRKGLDLVHPLDGGGVLGGGSFTSDPEDRRLIRAATTYEEVQQPQRRESVISPSRRVSNQVFTEESSSRLSYSQSRQSLHPDEDDISLESASAAAMPPPRRSSSVHEISPALRSHEDEVRRMSIREESFRYSSEEQYRPQRSSFSGPVSDGYYTSRSSYAGSDPPRGPYSATPDHSRGPYGASPSEYNRSPQSDVHAIVNHHYNATYRQVDQQLECAQQLLAQRRSNSPQRPYPLRPKNRNSNVLSAILCLIKEIDGPSLEVVEMAVRCRMEELED